MKKTTTNPFNPQWYGYAPATDKQIISGSAPFVYNYLPHDSQACITAKNIYNQTHQSVYSPDTIVGSHPASNLIQSSTLTMNENMIQQQCQPSFKYDSMNSGTNYGSNNFGTNNYG